MIKREPGHESALIEIMRVVQQRDGYPGPGVDPACWLRIDREMCAWTALLDGRPVGHASVSGPDLESDTVRVWEKHTGGNVEKVAVPSRMFVDPTIRSGGVGRALVAAVFRYIRDGGYSPAFAAFEHNLHIIEWYERLGFEELERVRHLREGSGLPGRIYTASAEVIERIAG